MVGPVLHCLHAQNFGNCEPAPDGEDISRETDDCTMVGGDNGGGGVNEM